MRVKMRVNLGGLGRKNPVTTASGTFASGREYSDFVKLSALGALTTKGVSLHAWEGNATPRIAETPSGMLNSIGLQNPGVKKFLENDIPWLRKQNVPIIVNVSGHTLNEYLILLKILEEEKSIDAYELNISCPNVDAGGMTFGSDVKSVEEIVTRARALATKPLIVKLTPNVGDIAEIARAAESSGADALSLINTVLGMAIDARTKKPLLARVVGGLSGPAVKPIALRMVYETYQAVSIPLLGMGGIMNGEDAVEFMLAGATAVAVGTANFVNPRATIEVIEGIQNYCEIYGVKDVNELIGGLQC
ncbi:MAG: dihydroorotate dehydrogenase [Coriobacteriaceae bacterium]|jgi:dihydroorotate dehydrogenase (NAD+) catalytic subunit|nr:dihydroorotate dehydrogenase [Coriobacteriaceae bacterium]